MRTLGIDIGKKSVKAVDLEHAFRRLEVHDYYEKVVAHGRDPIEVAGELVREIKRQPDRIAVALPASQTTLRNLSLPTRDKKAVLAAVNFELEDDLPFNPQEIISDFTPISHGKTGSELFVEASLKKYVGDFLVRLKEEGIDPDVITTEAWAYRSLFNQFIPVSSQEAPILFVHIGARTSTLYLQWKGKPAAIKSVGVGGGDLTDALAAKYGLSAEDAEKTKTENSFLVTSLQKPSSTPEQIEFSDTLFEVLRKLILETRQVNLTAKNIAGRSPSMIYIAGPTVLLPGLRQVFEEETHLPTSWLRTFTKISQGSVAFSEFTDLAHPLSAGIALSAIAFDKVRPVNFRKDEFSKAGRRSGFKVASLKKPLTYGGFVAATLMVSMIVQSSYYKSEITKTDEILERNIKNFFGGYLSKSAAQSYLSNLSRLQGSIDKELSRQRTLAKLFGENPRSPVDLLKKISEKIPSTIIVDLIRFDVGASAQSSFKDIQKQSASLTFLVQNPQVAEQLATQLGELFDGLERSKIEQIPSPDGDGQKWKITFTGRPKEILYGR